MTDEELDSTLASAVNVDPSPDFLARVRMTVAAESMSPQGHTRWPAVAAGAVLSAALVVTLIGMWPRAAGRPLAPAPPTGDAVLVSPHITMGPAPRAVVAPPVRVEAPRTSRRRLLPLAVAASPALAPSRAPEVLVSPDEQRAFETLVARAAEGRIPPVLPSDDVSAQAALAFSKIEVPGVEVEPLPPIAPLEVE